MPRLQHKTIITGDKLVLSQHRTILVSIYRPHIIRHRLPTYLYRTYHLLPMKFIARFNICPFLSISAILVIISLHNSCAILIVPRIVIGNLAQLYIDRLAVFRNVYILFNKRNRIIRSGSFYSLSDLLSRTNNELIAYGKGWFCKFIGRIYFSINIIYILAHITKNRIVFHLLYFIFNRRRSRYILVFVKTSIPKKRSSRIL